MIKERVLVITDDPTFFRSIQRLMQSTYIDVIHTISVLDALETFAIYDCCLIIVDICLSKTNGAEVLSAIRRVKSTPVLSLTESITEGEKVALFGAGANAVLEKPVDKSVCAAQAKSLIQLHLDQTADETVHPLIFGTELMIDPAFRKVMIDGNQVALTRKEFDLLLCFARHPGRVWSRTQLYSQVWSDDLGLSGENVVKVHIGNLRKKLADLGKNYIQTSWGVGYRFVPPDEGIEISS